MDRAESSYEAMCFVTELEEEEFISSDAMSKLRQVSFLNNTLKQHLSLKISTAWRLFCYPIFGRGESLLKGALCPTVANFVCFLIFESQTSFTDNLFSQISLLSNSWSSVSKLGLGVGHWGMKTDPWE